MLYTGTLLELGVIDKCDSLFEKDCEITWADQIPVVLDFDVNDANSVVGSATVNKDGNNIAVNCVFDHAIPGEYLNNNGRIYIGGYYNISIYEVDIHGVLHISKANLLCVGIIPKYDAVNDKYYISQFISLKSAEECPHSKYWQMTNKYECTLINGMYSRCRLESGEKCPFARKED